MKTTGLLIAAALNVSARAAAADSVVQLTLDGRPVDRHAGVAVFHHGSVFADAIDLTRCFDGFISLQRSGAATITIGANTGTFTPGSASATIDGAAVALPDAPFVLNSDLFVPLDTFVTRVAGAKVHYGRVGHRADIRVNTRSRR